MSVAHPSKLHGRAFYESIGSPTMVVAPMVDRSEFVSPHTSIEKEASLTKWVGMEAPHPFVPGRGKTELASGIYTHAACAHVWRTGKNT